MSSFLTSPPLDFICPITQDIMNDPVIDNEGVSYERNAIENWLSRGNNTSPATNLPLRKEDLRSNLALKSQIDSYLNGDITVNQTVSSSSSSSTKGEDFQNQVSLSPKKLKIKLTKSHYHQVNGNEEETKAVKMLSLYPPLFPEGCNTSNMSDLINENREPVTIVCVVDVSGSMDTEGVLKSADGQNESLGLTILDITKHALKTIISCLGPKDKFACVKYSDDAKVVVHMGKMTDLRKEQALREISGLHVEGCTNIWAGLKLSLDEIQKVIETNPKDTTTKAIFLLTDGCPTASPSRGEVFSLRKKIEKNFQNKLPCIINTYGFGYSLRSELLNQIANCGNGSFSFIPDAGMVGTIFVNSISNLMSSYAANVKVYIEFKEDENTEEAHKSPLNASDASAVFNNFPLINQYQYHEVDEDNLIIKIGNISYGQPINLILNEQYGARDISACKIEYFGCESEFNQMFIFDDIEISTTKHSYEEKKDQPVDFSATKNEIEMLQNLSLNQKDELVIEEIDNGETSEVRFHRLRLSIVQTLREIKETTNFAHLSTVKDRIEYLKQEFKDFENQNIQLKDGYAIYQDLTGQITMAVASEQHFRKWGKHYLISLANAHCIQACNNFKDPGVQIYGGAVFEEIREIVDLTFNDLPAPTPSRPQVRQGRPMSTPAFSMASMNCASNGCFTSDSLLTIKEKSGSNLKYHNIPISEVRKGMLIVIDDKKNTDTVECVVRHKIVTKDSAKVVRFQKTGLGITMWHPILLSNKNWVFPYDFHKATEKAKETTIVTLSAGEYVYNLVMKNRSNILINNVTCCTLGHGLKGPVIEHPFYGTEKVIENYRNLDKDNYETGFVSVNENVGMLNDDEKAEYNETNAIVKIRRSKLTNMVVGFEKVSF